MGIRCTLDADRDRLELLFPDGRGIEGDARPPDRR